MKSFEIMAYKTFEPLAQKYNLQFKGLNQDEFFLIGNGFALWIFVDPRDVRSDVWYVTLDHNGNILTFTLMYLMKERLDQEDSKIFGSPTTFEERISANMRVDSAWLMNKCKDILSGDKNWLEGYPDQGDYSRHVANFLAPYFRAQGYEVNLRNQ